MIDVEVLRARLRAAYKDHPDDSHGDGHRNGGIQAALSIVAELAGDIDFTTPCEPEGDPRQIGERNWCKAHFAHMGSAWCCDLAEQPWVWHDAVLRAGWRSR